MQEVVRVLLVDDQDTFRRAMGSVVAETPGFMTVGEAARAEDALSLSEQLLPDLVLMDVNLPVLDGVAAARILRAGSRPPIVILLSTYDEETGAGFVAESGALAYVTKSDFGPELLTELWHASGGVAGRRTSTSLPPPCVDHVTDPPAASTRSRM
jgi:DNA-binding NarL/FixJ family response regulator